jgi:hypothetical protein
MRASLIEKIEKTETRCLRFFSKTEPYTREEWPEDIHLLRTILRIAEETYDTLIQPFLLLLAIQRFKRRDIPKDVMRSIVLVRK